MSSFWSTSDGESATTGEKEFDGGGGFELIPDKTNCLALIHSASWDKDRDDNRFIKVRFDVIKPDPVAKRVVFLKLWVKDPNPQWKEEERASKRDKALRMLAAIDANAGGKLAKAGKEPDNDALALALTNKQMMIKVMVYSMPDRQNPDGPKIEGNWIAAVGSKGGSMAISELEAPKAPAKEPKGSAGTRPPFDDDLDDEVPFD